MGVILPLYVRQIRGVYAAIARQIEELLFSWNEAQKTNDPKTKQLARRIEVFLSKLEQSVRVENLSAERNLPVGKKERFLGLLQRELSDIRRLSAFIALGERKPNPEIISKINQLYKAIEAEMKEQERVAA